MEKNYRTGRWKLWIDREIQLRFVIFVLVALGVASILISLAAFYSVWFNVLEPMVRSGNTVGDVYAQSLSRFIPISAGITLVLLVLACLGMLVLSHRIAGPAYRILQILRDLQDGKEPVFTLRKGDSLGPVMIELRSFAIQHKAMAQAAWRVVESWKNTEVKDLSFNIALKGLESQIPVPKPREEESRKEG